MHIIGSHKPAQDGFSPPVCEYVYIWVHMYMFLYVYLENVICGYTLTQIEAYHTYLGIDDMHAITCMYYIARFVLNAKSWDCSEPVDIKLHHF